MLDQEDFLQSPRIQNLKEQIISNESEMEKRKFLVLLAKEIVRAINELAMARTEDTVNVENFDEVTASLRNELSRANKPLQQLLSQLNLTAQEQTKFMKEIETKSDGEFKSQFQPILIKRPKDFVQVENLSEVPLVENVGINNLSEIEPYFKDLGESLKGALNVNVEAPVVNVPAPIVNIPQAQVNIPEVNLDQLIDALDRNLNKLSTNSVKRPLSVRLSDGENWIKEIVKVQKETARAVAAFAGGANQIRLLDANNSIVTPAQQEQDTLKAFANVAAGQTDSSIVAAVTNKKIRVVSAVCVAGATATTLTFNSKPAGAGAAITALFANGANGGEVLGYNPKGWFDTVISEGLTVTTGAGATTGIQITYILV